MTSVGSTIKDMKTGYVCCLKVKHLPFTFYYSVTYESPNVLEGQYLIISVPVYGYEYY